MPPDPEIYALAQPVGERLVTLRKSMAVAESCTGGLLGAALTDVPGSSAYFLGGVISYADRVKKDQLGVSEATLRQYGAVSEETAAATARGGRRADAAAVGGRTRADGCRYGDRGTPVAAGGHRRLDHRGGRAGRRGRQA